MPLIVKMSLALYGLVVFSLVAVYHIQCRTLQWVDLSYCNLGRLQDGYHTQDKILRWVISVWQLGQRIDTLIQFFLILQFL